MPVQLIYALWGAASVFVVWTGLARRAMRGWESRQAARAFAALSPEQKLLAVDYPEILPE